MATECQRNAPIDYEAAAERLLVALCFIASKVKDKPVPAIQLCAHIFDRQTREHWSRETRRRRVRDTVDVARKLLRSRNQGAEVAADGRGYWMERDPAVIAWYAGQRRRHGLREMVRSQEITSAVENAGQKALFPEPPSPQAGVRH